MTIRDRAAAVQRQFPAFAGIISIVAIVPVLRWAAKRDRWTHNIAGSHAVDIHHSPGLFLKVGLLAIIPVVMSAVSHERLRRTNIAVAVLCMSLAGVCEAFVALDVFGNFQF